MLARRPSPAPYGQSQAASQASFAVGPTGSGPDFDDFRSDPSKANVSLLAGEKAGVPSRTGSSPEWPAPGSTAMRKVFALIIGSLVLFAAAEPADAKKMLRLTLQLPLRTALGQNLVMFK